MHDMLVHTEMYMPLSLPPPSNSTPGADPGGGLEVQGDSGDRETEEGTAGSC